MPHFPEYNLLFIHIPKTGGSSYEKYMLDKTRTRLWGRKNIFPDPNLNKISLQHQTYQTIYQYREVLGIDFNDKLKKLAFVRNPYDRIVSDIFWLKFNPTSDNQEEIYNIIRHYYFGRDDLDNHNIPQYKFVTDENEKLIPDITILKMENLTEELQKYGFTDYKGPSQANSYMKYLNKDSIRLINLFYKKDFEMFGYTMIE
jgi:hypothetical protein